MGLLKKIFKPVAKVLDKVIPNEIKPALPYLAAFAPVFGPAGMQSFIGSTMGRRALTSGLMNIGAQLAQEGNEGDINLLSAGLGALSGAMTTPGAASAARGATTESQLTLDQIKKGAIGATDTSAQIASQQAAITEGLKNQGILSQAKDFGLETFAKGSEFLRPGGEIPNLFSKEGVKIATAPAATATGDVMQAEARRLEKQQIIDDALAAAEALEDSGARAQAIRNAMSAYDFFTEQEIEDTIASAGYKAGGRVGFETGGPTAGQGLGALLEEGSKYITKKSDTDETDTINRIYEEQGTEGLAAYLDRNPDLKDKYVIVESYGGELTVMPNKLHPDNREGEVVFMLPEMKAKGGRVGFRFGGIDEAIEMVEKETVEKGKEGIMQAAGEDPLLVEEYNKYVFDLLEQRPNAKPMSFAEFKRMAKAGMKDGGLMDLGGKEMDLRGGGFVPIGKKERADDVPARLSKNEFVMTADAVRAAGGGSVNKGAKRMYNLMNTLEARA